MITIICFNDINVTDIMRSEAPIFERLDHLTEIYSVLSCLTGFTCCDSGVCLCLEILETCNGFLQIFGSLLCRSAVFVRKLFTCFQTDRREKNVINNRKKRLAFSERINIHVMLHGQSDQFITLHNGTHTVNGRVRSVPCLQILIKSHAVLSSCLLGFSKCSFDIRKRLLAEFQIILLCVFEEECLTLQIEDDLLTQIFLYLL